MHSCDITRIVIGYVLSDVRVDWLVGNMSVYQENMFILHILRFSHQILLCEKAFRILLRPIREAKRVSHT